MTTRIVVKNIKAGESITIKADGVEIKGLEKTEDGYISIRNATINKKKKINKEKKVKGYLVTNCFDEYLTKELTWTGKIEDAWVHEKLSYINDHFNEKASVNLETLFPCVAIPAEWNKSQGMKIVGNPFDIE